MRRRLLGRYLLDRLWLLLAFALSTAVILALLGLLLSFHDTGPADIAANVGYALLLSTLVLLVCLAVDLARWWPASRRLQALLDEEVGLEALASFPRGGNREQAAFHDLVAKLYALAVAERLRYQDAHQRQLTFISLWAHQMKTPLSAISLAAQEAAAQDPDELRATIAGIDEEAGKLADGLELVLGMARLQDFSLDYHVRRVDLLQSLRKVINRRKKQFIRLAIFPAVETAGGADKADGAAGAAGSDGTAGDWLVLTDEKWNAFAVDQVVANALKYASQAGKPHQRLKFRLSRRPDAGAPAIRLTIADEGPGIPAQDLPRIFEPFFTGENGRRYADATGIGLYLVKQVLDRLGHQIAVDSVEGQGTAVTLTYPVEPGRLAPQTFHH